MIRKTPLTYVNDHKPFILTAGVSFLITALLILFLFAIAGFIPFGNKALLFNDGAIQMLDLFSWYKNVLTGSSFIEYTMTKSLGGSNFPVFTYYLASPLNLLILFFDKSQTPLFMNVLYLLKASFAAAFMSIYLVNRFSPSDKNKYATTVMLSVSYALSQFLIAQSSNIMWLDGAYMLPLILTECERVIKGKRITRLAIVLALTVCFNWYSGLIDMLFTGFWFLFELARTGICERKSLRSILITVLKFAESCICALLISSVILIPTLMKLSGRTYGHAGLSILTDLGMIGTVKSTLLNYSFGMISVRGGVSLFAGSFVLLGVVLLFIAGTQKLKEKIMYGILLIFTVLIFIWQPLVALFSMLRYVEAFWYRYSYVGIFALIYLAGAFYLESSKQKLKAWMPLAVAVLFSLTVALLIMITPRRPEDILFFISLNLISPVADSNNLLILCKIIFPILCSVFMCLLIASGKNSQLLKKTSTGLLSLTVIAELICGQFVLSVFYSTEEGPHITDYVKNEEVLLAMIDDEPFYRILQTTYHSNHGGGLPASYNEPMAFGFNSVTSFVSDPEEDTVYFLNDAGYAAHADTITVTPSENLALDSLLGVRYVILPSGSNDTSGLQYVNGIEGFKDIYINSYEFPVAFTYSNTGDYNSKPSCPALYLNDIYARLTGIENIFTAVNASESKNGSDITYSVDLGDDYDPDSYILYANLITAEEECASKILIDGEPYIGYAQFLAPSMVRISSDKNNVDVTLTPDDPEMPATVIDAQFYLLDLNLLREASDIANANAVTDYELRDGYGCFTVNDGCKGESLFISVPYGEGWTITLNGHEVSCNTIGDALMSIPLEDGQNKIEIRYTMPYKYAGIITCLSGIVLLAVLTGIDILNTRKPNRTHRSGKKHN